MVTELNLAMLASGEQTYKMNFISKRIFVTI